MKKTPCITVGRILSALQCSEMTSYITVGGNCLSSSAGAFPGNRRGSELCGSDDKYYEKYCEKYCDHYKYCAVYFFHASVIAMLDENISAIDCVAILVCTLTIQNKIETDKDKENIKDIKDDNEDEDLALWASRFVARAL